MVSGKQHLGELCIGTRFLYHMGKISTLTSGLWGDKKKTHPLPIPHIGRSGLRMSDCLRSCPISSTCVLEEGFPGGAHAKEHACQCRRLKTRRFNPLVRKIPWRRACQPTPVFLPRACHGERNLVCYILGRRKESDTTQRHRAHTENRTSNERFYCIWTLSLLSSLTRVLACTVSYLSSQHFLLLVPTTIVQRNIGEN